MLHRMEALSLLEGNTDATGFPKVLGPAPIGAHAPLKCKIKKLCKLKCPNVSIGFFNAYVASFRLDIKENGLQKIEKNGIQSFRRGSANDGSF